jgi:hypothetical protein
MNLAREFRATVTALALAAAALPAQTQFAPTGSLIGDGSGLYDDQFLGIRVTFAVPTAVDSLVFALPGSTGSFFAAIVSLTAVADLPDGNPFTGTEVFAYTTFSLNGAETGDFTLPFATSLSAGSYAFVLGTGLYGTSSEGGNLLLYQAVAGSSAIAWTGGAWQEDSGAYRIGYNLAAVPEPSSYALGMALTVLSYVAWRRRSRSA